MLSVDTNVVVRLLANDEPKQTAAVLSLFNSGPIWISKSVLLEVEWVMTSTYRKSREAVVEVLAKLIGFENVRIEDSAAVGKALTLARQGLDFADALHLCSAPHGSTFVTFDKSLVRLAKRNGETNIVELIT